MVWLVFFSSRGVPGAAPRRRPRGGDALPLGAAPREGRETTVRRLVGLLVTKGVGQKQDFCLVGL